MDIKAVLDYWNKGKTIGEVSARYDLNREDAFAILQCSDGLSHSQIGQRIKKVNPGMSGGEIRRIMQKD